MSEDTMRKALADFERSLESLVPNADERRAFITAVYNLIDALLSRVTIIVNQRAISGSLAPAPDAQEDLDDPTGTDAGAHPQG